jgi:hypothetical protein
MLVACVMALVLVACDSEGVTHPADGGAAYISSMAVGNGGGPPPPLSKVQPGGGVLTRGDTLRLYAYDAAGNQLDVGWGSSDRAVATISSSGLLTAVDVGSVTISARSRSVSLTADFTVVEAAPAPVVPNPDAPKEGDDPPTVASVTISPLQSTIEKGKTTTLSATVKDSNGKTLGGQSVHWTSSNPSTATVNVQGGVSGIATGTVTITATVDGKQGTASVTVTEPVNAPAPPSVGAGIWISKSELNALPMSGSSWSEVRAAADASWQVQPIEQQSSQTFHVNAMAGALVYARLAPDASANAYRVKVAQAIKDLIAIPVQSTSVTAPSRHLGTWAITADLIDLAAYDPSLDSQFRSWLRNRLDHSYSSSPSSIRLAAKQRPNNIGAWSRFSLAAASVYLDDRAELDRLAAIMRFWMGDRAALSKDPFDGVAGGWGAGSTNHSNTWQQNPNDRSTWRGIVAAGVMRDGNRFDGIQPEDHWRNRTGAYSASSFPGDQTDHRYPEESLEGSLGAALILYRAGYTNMLSTADNALLRAARSIKYFADNHPSKGYHYFTGPHEASRPLINYFYPGAGLPGDRSRNQLAGRAKGFAWTYWTHGGRSVN